MRCIGSGSSPLVRGKPARTRQPCIHSRIIPACAGQTVLVVPCHDWCPDHPRLCGANEKLILAKAVGIGSSPLVRGKRDLDEIHVLPVRIVPACAGQTSSSHPASCPATDHPRLCGANSPTLLAKHSLDYVKRLDLHTPLTFRRRYSTHHHRPNRRYRDALLHPVRRPREGLLAESFSEDCLAGRRISSNPS